MEAISFNFHPKYLKQLALLNFPPIFGAAVEPGLMVIES